MDNLERVFTVNGAGVVTHDKIHQTKDYTYIIPINSIVKIKNAQVYNKKEEAQYVLFVKNMKDNSKLSNYKSSPYYDYYIKRAKLENPELLI